MVLLVGEVLSAEVLKITFCALLIKQCLLTTLLECFPKHGCTEGTCFLSYSDIAYWSGLVDLHTDNVFLTEAPGTILQTKYLVK